MSIDTIIRFAQLSDLKYIDSLAKKENKSLGFLPKVVYESAITGYKPSIHRWSDKCGDKLWVAEENRELVGFVLAGFGKYGKVHQICIQEDARMLERGNLLLDAVTNYGERIGKMDYICGCADDLESNIFWQAMEWVKVGHRKGISYKNVHNETSDRKINIYRWSMSDLGLLLPENRDLHKSTMIPKLKEYLKERK